MSAEAPHTTTPQRPWAPGPFGRAAFKLFAIVFIVASVYRVAEHFGRLHLEIDSSPQGADVLENGVLVGSTPLVVDRWEIPRREWHVFVVRVAGCEPAVVRIGGNYGGTGAQLCSPR
jgi:hypothetical protein